MPFEADFHVHTVHSCPITFAVQMSNKRQGLTCGEIHEAMPSSKELTNSSSLVVWGMR